jgi:hypothetical protein
MTMIDSAAFIRGYFAAVELVLFGASDLLRDDNVPLDTAVYHQVAVSNATMDCLRFIDDNAENLEHYLVITNEDALKAGLYFALKRFDSRNSGFQDAGDGPLFKRLDDAAEAMGRVEPVISDDDLICFDYQPEIT